MTELYLVNTEALNLGDKSFEAVNQQARLFFNILHKVPNFKSPYWEFFHDGQYRFCSVISRITNGAREEILEEYVERLISGKDTVINGLVTPITTLIQYSPEEIYPELMKSLEKKYDFKRIRI